MEFHMFNDFFSFIFKDDKVVEDKEVINNPQEPMRIEEKVSTE